MMQRISRLQYPNQSERCQRPCQQQTSDFKQRRGVGPSFLSQRKSYGIIDDFFTDSANAGVRRIREEIVDDAVRLALGEEAGTYAPTLLEVARLLLARPLTTLGLVGILESRYALHQRVERMVNLPMPKRTGLTLGSIVGILAFSSVAVPMG